MPNLTNTNWLLFGNLLCSGLNHIDAYEKVYGTRLGAGQQIKKLLKNPRFLTLFYTIRAQAVEKARQMVVQEASFRVLTQYRDREIRIKKLSELAEKCENVMHARATLYARLPGVDYKMPGAREGIVVPVWNQGKMTSTVDTAFMKEYRGILQQINEEVGPDRINWTEDDGLKALADALEKSPTGDLVDPLVPDCN